MNARDPISATSAFARIRSRFTEGRDYRIQWRPGHTGVLIMAPHGGGIEPGTGRIAAGIAGGDHGFYAFVGEMARGNRMLHMPSTRFDEPCALALAAAARIIVVVHGCREPRRIAYLGGTDAALHRRLHRRLRDAGIAAAESDRFPGRHPDNLCNRFSSARGIQMELSTALRDDLTGGPSTLRTAPPRPAFRVFTSAVRAAVHDALTGGSQAVEKQRF